MQLHQIKPKHKNKDRKRVGRGGKRGTYSGKGIKGQRSRASRKFEPIIRGLIKRYPKLRGYKFGSNGELVAVINLKTLQDKFDDKSIISPNSLIDKKLAHKMKGMMPLIKILGDGEVSKEFTIKGCKISKQAEEKIKKAGGIVEKIKNQSTKVKGKGNPKAENPKVKNSQTKE
jgi:large subunit ribosomal protein L15